MAKSIRVEGLTHMYGKKVALNNVSFTVNRGSVTALLGRNGAGKSTLLKILSGILPLKHGDIFVHGISLHHNAQQARALIGYLGELPPVHRDVTVKKFLWFCGRLRGIPVQRLKKRINPVLRECGLTKFADKRIGTLSKGYQQRVGIAQAIIHAPRVLILDEPTASLDQDSISDFRELIKTLGKQYTVIIATHLMTDVTALCQDALVLHEGEVQTQRSITDLLDNADTDIIEVAFRNPPKEDAITALEGVEKATLERNNRYRIKFSNRREAMDAILVTAVKEEWGVMDIAQNETALTDILQNKEKEHA